VIAPVSVGVTLIAKVAASPARRLSRSQRTVPAAWLHLPSPPGSAETKTTPLEIRRAGDRHPHHGTLEIGDDG